MKIELMAFDLDGTLLAPDHRTVSDRTVRALAAAHAHGIRLVIATGRPLCLTGEVTARLPMIDHLILSNGAAIYDRNAGLYLSRCLIPTAHAVETARCIAALPVFSNFYLNGGVHVERDKIRHFLNPDMPEVFLEFFRKNMLFYDTLAPLVAANAPEQVNLYTGDPAVRETVLADYAAHGYEVSASTAGELTANAAGVNKGAALRALCAQLGIDPAHAAAFGDAGNDAAMLEQAGIPIAMGNADAHCRAVAAHITASNAEDGVAQFVERYLNFSDLK